MKTNELLFEYKVKYKNKEYKFYANTDIEEYLNINNLKYVRNMIHPFIKPLLVEVINNE